MSRDTWKLTGFSPVRKFLWYILQQELGWKTDDYGGLVPIVTIQQQPEFESMGKPYIVTGSMVDQDSRIRSIERETVSLVIYTPNEEDIRVLGNLVRAYFGRDDESAQAVNRYIDANGSVNDKKFDIKTISVLSTESADPAEQEGGQYDANIVIRIDYVSMDDDRLVLY